MKNLARETPNLPTFFISLARETPNLATFSISLARETLNLPTFSAVRAGQADGRPGSGAGVGGGGPCGGEEPGCLAACGPTKLSFSTTFLCFYMARLLRTSYSDVVKDKIGPLALNCCTKLTGNAYFPGAAPYVSAMQAALADYTPAASIRNPIPEQTALLGQYRKVLDASLASTARYANGEYPADEAALLSTGLELSKEREKHTVLDPPKKYSLGDGTEADTLCAKATRADHAVATEVRYTDDPDRPVAQWLSCTFTRPTALLRGYKKKTEVFAMFRSIGGDTDDQPFSDVISRIVQ